MQCLFIWTHLPQTNISRCRSYFRLCFCTSDWIRWQQHQLSFPGCGFYGTSWSYWLCSTSVGMNLVISKKEIPAYSPQPYEANAKYFLIDLGTKALPIKSPDPSPMDYLVCFGKEQITLGRCCMSTLKMGFMRSWKSDWGTIRLLSTFAMNIFG